MGQEYKNITLSPAYRKDYSTRREALEAFDSGDDFVICSVIHGPSRYASKRELARAKFTHATIRYNLQTRVAIAKI